jgi:large subunit ribosomal protein L4
MFNMEGKQVGEVQLSEAVFGIEPNGAVLHEAVKNYLANQRQGTQSALTKGEVSYSTKKPWRQKGTGRARAGYKGSPVWTHGGVAFAPKPRDYRYSLNKKVKALAIRSALSIKAAAGSVIVVDALKMDSIKTKTFAEFLKAVGAEGKSMIITNGKQENVVKSSRNIPGVETGFAYSDANDNKGKVLWSIFGIMNAKNLIVDKEALSVIEEVYA